MKDIQLADGDTVVVLLQGALGKLYISAHERGGFLIVADRGFLIQPRADNSIRILPELLDKDKPHPATSP